MTPLSHYRIVHRNRISHSEACQPLAVTDFAGKQVNWLLVLSEVSALKQSLDGTASPAFNPAHWSSVWLRSGCVTQEQLAALLAQGNCWDPAASNGTCSAHSTSLRLLWRCQCSQKGRGPTQPWKSFTAVQLVTSCMQGSFRLALSRLQLHPDNTALLPAFCQPCLFSHHVEMWVADKNINIFSL